MRLQGDIRAQIVKICVHAGVFSLLANILMLTTPLYLMQIYDRVLSSFSIETLIYLSVIAALALCFLGLMEMIRSMYFQRIASAIDRQFGPEVIQVALKAGAAGQLDPQPMRDLGSVRAFIGARGLATLFDLPFAPFFVVVLYFVHPALFWLTVAGIVVLLIVAVLNQYGIRSISAVASEKSAQANNSAMAFASAAETIRAMGMQRGVIEAWGKNFAEATQANDQAASVNAAFGAVSRTLRMGLQLAILGVGAWLVIGHEMTPGMIFASAIIAGRALQPIDQLIGGWRNTVEAGRAWARLTSMMARLRKEQPRKITLPDPKGSIVTKDLTYAPPGATDTSEAIIRRISFAIQPGEAIAVIGPSRAGKSTLAKLLVGALTPTSGEVRIDGTEISNWDEEQLGASVGYLAQDVQLIAGTVADNIARFSLDPQHGAVTDAAMRAQAHEVITGLRDSYNTQINAVGNTLSGGEKQRIGLARAFYGNPRILVLDEPNANLDTEGEAALERAILDARERGTTVIVVTHRLPMATACDRILALRKGMIEAFGPSHQVLQQLRSQNAVVPMHRGAAAAKPMPMPLHGEAGQQAE